MREIDVSIKRLYLIDDKSIPEISQELDVSEEYISRVVKYMKKQKRSSGEQSLINILNEIYPGQKIEEQRPFHGQYFDFYLPKLRLAIEVDGVQHFKKNDLFHGKGITGHYKFRRRSE